MSTTTDHTTPSRRPKVSVCVITYNQERYIRKCLQSLVEQQTDFDFEIIVGDDCSTDGTRAVVMEFAVNYPGVVRAILQEKNTGGSKNNLDVHAAALGEYVAHVDGDDYALPGKLQAQADFLDTHPVCNVAWHRMLVRNEATGTEVEDLIDLARLPRAGFRRDDLLRFGTLGLHSSKMYRASVARFKLPPFPVLDFFANVEHVGEGLACFVSDRPLGVYRTGIGIASGTKSRFVMAQSLDYFGQSIPGVRRAITMLALLLMLAAVKNIRWREAHAFGAVLLRHFALAGVLDLARNWHVTKMLRVPAAARV